MFACCYFRFGNLLHVLSLWHDLWGGEEYNYSGLHRCGLCILPDPCLFPHPRAEGWEKDHAKWVISKAIRLLKIKIPHCLVDFLSSNISFYLFSDFRKKIPLLLICNRIFQPWVLCFFGVCFQVPSARTCTRLWYRWPMAPWSGPIWSPSSWARFCTPPTPPPPACWSKR